MSKNYAEKHERIKAYNNEYVDSDVDVLDNTPTCDFEDLYEYCRERNEYIREILFEHKYIDEKLRRLCKKVCYTDEYCRLYEHIHSLSKDDQVTICLLGVEL